MTQNTSLRKSYNHFALKGIGIDDERFISDWNENPFTPGSLDPSLAYTKQLMEVAIDLSIKDDLEKGTIDEKEATKRRSEHMKQYRHLLAENGKLK